MRGERRLWAWVTAATALVSTRPVSAREPTPDDPAPRFESASAAPEDRAAASGVRTPLDVSLPVRLFAGTAIGRGLRFNNPYRLQTELGDGAESLSLTAPYLDLSFGVAVGSRGRVAHGGALHVSFSLGGVPQQVLTPSYVVLVHQSPHLDFMGRAGLPLVLTPEGNVGFELAAGAIYNVTAALGVTGTVVGDLFYGAATPDASRTAIPLVSLELGIRYDYEVLP